MPHRRDRGRRARDHRAGLPLTAASVLPGLLFALLLVFCPPVPEDAPADPVAVAQGPLAGCGKGGVDDDRGAHPAPPPRGTVSYEPPPLPYPDHGPGTPLRLRAEHGTAPDRGPPPRDPPTPGELSVLRV
ncbi:hypothetical protein [Streptomyces sp. CAU 1734]|uniref:hypothetical protein n=1 Tax=Streptomyces sp. CAU 1734 TaxID=3140360 RepID=UPI00326147B3